jgi:hypothetical protein
MRFAGSKLNSFMSDGGMDSQMLADYGIRTRSQEREAASMADATVAMGGLQGAQAVASAGYEAAALEAQGQAAGQMAIGGGIGSLASGIAGGFINKPSSGLGAVSRSPYAAPTQAGFKSMFQAGL